MSANQKPQGDTKPLNLPKEETEQTLEPTTLPTSEIRSAWAVRLVVSKDSIPIQLRVHENATIGRSDPDTGFKPDIDLLPHGALQKGVSRRHAEIRAGKDSLVIVDLGSTNGTRIDGFPLTPQEPYRLNHGTILTIGTVQIQVNIAIMPTHSGLKVTRKTGRLTLPRDGEDEGEDKRRLILIVEDDLDTAKTFADMVESLGYRSEMVHRTGDAMRFIANEVPDCIFIDLQMPDFPGIDICRMIRNDLNDDQIPLFVISGTTDEKIIKEAFEAGANVFLSKPIGVDQLVADLERFVGYPLKASESED